MELKKYKKIVVVCFRDFMDDDLGFLLGDLIEKLMFFLVGIIDVLILMYLDDNYEGNIYVIVEYVIERVNIEFISMVYFCGCLIDDVVLIIDEV